MWEGSSRTGDNRTTYQGTFNIPNLSEENEIHEVTMTFSADKSKGDKVKEMMRKDGQAVIREQLGRYVASLKEEFSQGLILPTKSTVSTAAVPPPPTSTPKATPSTPTSIQSTKNNQPGPLETQDVKIQETFSCSKVDLFRTFCDIDRVKAFTHNSVSHYDCKQGGFFSLLSDNITGRFLKIEPYDRIDMLWRFKSWPSDHHSHVSLLFQEKAGQTKLIVQQTGVPAQYYENTRVCLRDTASSTQANSIAIVLGRMETLLSGQHQINVRLRISFVLEFDFPRNR